MLTARFSLRAAGLALLLMSVVFVSSFTNAPAQENCKTQLQQAEKAYDNGRFDETIALLDPCLKRGEFDETDKKYAYRLLSLTYLSKNYVDQAKESIRKLLELVPAFEPDPEQDPPTFTNMVKEMKREIRPTQPEPAPIIPDQPESQPKEVKKKGGGAKWLLIGGGVAVLGAGAAVALGGKGGTTPPPSVNNQLPTPPPLP